MTRTLCCVLVAMLMLSSCTEDPVVGDDEAPADVTDLRADSIGETYLQLTWTLPGDDGRTGTASEYEMRYAAIDSTSATWGALTESITNSIRRPAGQEHQLWVNELQPITDYVFALRTVDDEGNWSEVSNFAAVTTICEIGVYEPNSDTAVCIGDTLRISWQLSECQGEMMRVYLMLDGEVCRSLGTASGGSFAWPARQCGEISEGYQVQLRSIENGSVGLSEEFRITPVCRLEATTPAAGDYLCSGGDTYIRWQRSSCCGDRVAINLLRNGIHVSVIADDEANDGQYWWQPQQWMYYSQGYSIQIVDLESGIRSVDSPTFSINAPGASSVTFPDGGERLHDDQQIELTWIPDECRAPRVRLELWQDGEFCSLIEDHAINSGSYPWTVESCTADSAGFTIRIVDGEFEDFSDDSFIIARECQIAVTAPEANRRFCEDVATEIRWDATRWCGDLVRIDLYRHGQLCDTVDEQTANDGAYEWIPEQCDIHSDGYTIGVRDLSTGVEGRSEGAFRIPVRCTMNINFPDGGEVLHAEQQVYVNWWRSECCDNDEVVLLKHHGVVCDTIPRHNPVSSNARWDIAGCNDDPDGYTVRIQSPDGRYWTESPAPFRILTGCWLVPMPFDDDEPVYCQGTEVPIRWTSSSHCGDQIRIELLHDGEPCRVIAEAAENDGHFTWTAAQYEGRVHGYEYRITAVDSGFSVVGPGEFSISGPVFRLQPDGLGDVATIGEALTLACAGDTILLADGVYTGNDNCDLGIENEVVLRSASGDPDLCIIDGEDMHGGTYLRQAIVEGVTFARMATTAIRVSGHYNPTIRNCVFRDNHGNHGGGLGSTSGADLVVENCLFLANEASRGGAVDIYASGAAFINCTFYGNSASYGSAINALNYDPIALTNCLLVANTGNSVFRCQSEGDVSLLCCNIFGHDEDYPGCISDQASTGGNMSLDPLFCDVANGDFRLRAGSPCLPDGNSCGAFIGAFGICSTE